MGLPSEGRSFPTISAPEFSKCPQKITGKSTQLVDRGSLLHSTMTSEIKSCILIVSVGETRKEENLPRLKASVGLGFSDGAWSLTELSKKGKKGKREKKRN
jgi:hypothetical protein